MSKQPKVIVVANNKGGVGKTASAAGIAGELARKGSNVLAIDLAPHAGNLTSVLHQRDYRGATAISVLLGDAELYSSIVPTKEPRLFLLPASIELLSQEKRLQTVPGYHNLLRKLLPKLVPYHYVVIDCPPWLGDLTSLALAAGDVYVVPCEPEPLAFYGLADIVKASGVVRENLNNGLRLAGIFLTAYHPNQRGAVQQGIADLVRQTYGESAMLPPIREDYAVPMSQATGQTVAVHAPESNAAQDYKVLTLAILEILCTDFNKEILMNNDKQGEPSAEEEPEVPVFVPFANRVRPVNKENLTRLAYWRRGTEQYWLDQALTQYFAQQDPHYLRPIPTKQEPG